MHGGGTSDHSQPGGTKTAELGNHFFGEAVAIVVLLGIAAEVFKRQNQQLDRGRGAFVRENPLLVLLFAGILIASGLPGSYLRTQRINRSQFGVLMAVDGKSLLLFPSLDGSDTSLQESRDLFPGIEAVLFRWFVGHRRFHLILIGRRRGLESCVSRGARLPAILTAPAASFKFACQSTPMRATRGLALHDACVFSMPPLG